MPEIYEPYEKFAAFYDRIMESVDYESWADYVEQLLSRFSKHPYTLVDLACGTGRSTLPFARRGYLITGVDLSTAMLQHARLKASSEGLQVDFLSQDLRQLDLPPVYDLALLFQDGLNYLLKEEDLLVALTAIYSILKPGSLFIFDLTRPKLRPAGDNGEISRADLGNMILVWESSFDPLVEIWSVNLTVTMQNERGRFEIFKEQHCEKEYPPELVSTLLKKSGFNLLALYPSFSFKAITGREPKLTFVAEKEIKR
ncbi:MAG: hypothetical protein AVO34_04830 [Firmicutes bacterium ML8_F2]|nr:MAG: hypothetical protein AVO34_04830 [Firmicutes bacterium ML8_F2]